MSSLIEEKYKRLRNSLDQHGYHQPLILDSITLVEALLNDLLNIKLNLQSTKPQLDVLKDHIANKEDFTLLYKSENARLLQENNELHQVVVKLKEEKETGNHELKRSFRKLETQNTELQFLNSQYLHKILALEQESRSKSEIILKLQEKNLQAVVQTPGGRKKSIAYRRQRMIIDYALPSHSQIPESVCLHVTNQRNDVYIADLVKIADQRIAQLQQDIININIDKEKWEEIKDYLNQQIESRDAEIERLTKLLSRGLQEPLGKDVWSKSNTYLIDHLSTQVEYLQKENKDLQNRLKESEGSRLEADNKTADLVFKNEELERELYGIGNMNKSLKKSAETTLENVQRKNIQFEEENLHLKKQVEEHRQNISTLEMERSSLASDNNRLASLLSARETDNHYLEELLEKVQEDKKRLNDNINYLASNEKQLVIEIEKAKKRGFKKSSNSPNYVERVLKKLEDERDYYRDESETLQHLLQEIHSRPTISSTTFTSPPKVGSKHSKSSIKTISSKSLQSSASEHQFQPGLSKKGRKSLSYDVLPGVKRTVSVQDFHHSSQPSIHSRISPLTEEATFFKDSFGQNDVAILMQEKDRILNEKERNISQMRTDLYQVVSERDQLQKQYNDAKLELQNIRLGIGSSPPRPSLASQATLRHLESDLDKSHIELRKASIEKESLRERLKIATDTKLTERNRLDKKLEELQNTVLKLERERTDLKMNNEASRSKITLLEDQIKTQSQKIAELHQEVTHHKMNSSKMRLLLEQTEKSVLDLQRQLSGKESELIVALSKAEKYQESLAEISSVNKHHKDDLTSLKNTINILDKEKDILQSVVDDKTERVAKLEEEILMKTKEIAETKLRISDFEIKFEKNKDAFGSKNHEIQSLQRQIDGTTQELIHTTRSHQTALQENHRLQEDLILMTTEHQAIMQELNEVRADREGLKKQIQHYVGEIGRIEAVLAVKDAERSEILDQYRTISLEASRFESQSVLVEGEVSNIRLQLLAKETELRHMKDHCESLEQEIKEYIVAQETYETQLVRLTKSYKDLELAWNAAQSEKESTQQDLIAVRDICVKLESSKENLNKQLSSKETAMIQLQKSFEEKLSEVDLLRHQMSSEKNSVHSLENLISSNREKEFEAQLIAQEKIAELQVLKEKIASSESRIESQNREIAMLRNRASDLEIEADRLRRQLTNEKFEREKANQELRRFSAKSSINSSLKHYFSTPVSLDKDNRRVKLMTTSHSSESSDAHSDPSSASLTGRPGTS